MRSWLLITFCSATAISLNVEDDEAVMLLQLKAESRQKGKWLPNCENGPCPSYGKWPEDFVNEPNYTRDSPCIGGWQDGDGRGSWEKEAHHGRVADHASALVSSREDCIVACKAREGGYKMPNEGDVAAGRTADDIPFRTDARYFFNGVTFPKTLNADGKGLCICEFNMIDIYTPEEALQPNPNSGCVFTATTENMFNERSLTRMECNKNWKWRKDLGLNDGTNDPNFRGDWHTCLLKKIWREPPCDWKYGRMQATGTRLDKCNGAQTIAECVDCVRRETPDAGGVNWIWRGDIHGGCFSVNAAGAKRGFQDGPYDRDWMTCDLSTYVETTTTTTTTGDTAAAVDDPHLKSVYGHSSDLTR